MSTLAGFKPARWLLPALLATGGCAGLPPAPEAAVLAPAPEAGLAAPGAPAAPPGAAGASESARFGTPLLVFAPAKERIDPGQSDPGFELLGGSLRIVVQGPGGPVPQATVTVRGPALAAAAADANGQAEFQEMMPGQSYTVQVSAPGHATLRVEGVEVQKRMRTIYTLKLSPGMTLQGRVTGPGGQPVAGAVVSDGLSATTSDAEGRYQLGGLAVGTTAVTVSKPRHRLATVPLAMQGQAAAVLDVSLEAETPRLYLDTSLSQHQQTFEKLGQALAAQGWSLGGPLEAGPGAWLLVTPAQAVPAAVAERAEAFVAAGGTLVLLGEWGGFGGLHHEGLNALAHRFGLHFNPDLVREPGRQSKPEWLALPSRPGATAEHRLALYNVCSVFALPPLAALVASGPEAYRVQSTSATLIAAGGSHKAGKVIALGDASAWSDQDTDGDGVANLDEADNAAFIAELLDW